MGTTDRVLSGSKTKGSTITHTASVRQFRQGINASSDEDYFGTALIPRVGAGPRFALYRGNTRVSNLNFDDTIRTADIPVKTKVSHYTASIIFTGIPWKTPYIISTSSVSQHERKITIKSADGRIGWFFPDSTNGAIRKVHSSRPNYRQTTFAVTGSTDDCVRQLGKQINRLFEGSIHATSGSDRPLTLNKTLFLRQTTGGPLGKQDIEHYNMVNISIGGVAGASDLATKTSKFGAAQELDVSFLGMEPVHQRINFRREEVNFGQPPTTPEEQPYHAVNNFNPVSFIEADERSMWPVNLFNAGNLPHRVFDGVIEPLDIRSVLLQMHDPRFEGHSVRAELQGAVAAGILGSKEIQWSRIKGDPPTPPFLDSPVSFNAGAVDIATGIDFTGTIPNQKPVPTAAQSRKHALQPFSNIDVQPTNPFFERSIAVIINSELEFTNPMEISRIKAKDGFRAYTDLGFDGAYFFPSTGSLFSSTDACQLILTSSDGTVRVFTGSQEALTTAWPPTGDHIPFQVVVPKPASMLIQQGSTVPADTASTSNCLKIQALSQNSSGIGNSSELGKTVLQPTVRHKYFIFDSSITPVSPSNGWGWDRPTTGWPVSNMLNGHRIGTSGLTTAAQVSQAIVDAINNPTVATRQYMTASLYTKGSFNGIKITALIPGQSGNQSTVRKGTAFNDTSGWYATAWAPTDVELGYVGYPTDAASKALLSGSGFPGKSSMGSITFTNDVVGATTGETFTIKTIAEAKNAGIPSAYISSSIFTFDATIPPEDGGIDGPNKYKVGIRGISNRTTDGGQAAIRSQSCAIAIAVYNSLGHSNHIQIGGLSRAIGGNFFSFMQPHAATFANTIIGTSRVASSSWVETGFVSGTNSDTSRIETQKNLYAAMTGSYGFGSKLNLLGGGVEGLSSVAQPESVIRAVQSKGGIEGNTIISSSIFNAKIKPAIAQGAHRQYGQFRGPPSARKSPILSTLEKNNFSDEGNSSPMTENANHGFYFSKKAGSIVYGDE